MKLPPLPEGYEWNDSVSYAYVNKKNATSPNGYHVCLVQIQPLKDGTYKVAPFVSEASRKQADAWTAEEWAERGEIVSEEELEHAVLVAMAKARVGVDR